MERTSFDTVIADLENFWIAQTNRSYYERDHISEHQIQRWSTLIGASRSELYDLIATYLARGFHNEELSYEFCDNVVNDINGQITHGLVTDSGEAWPSLFCDVYLAFDRGEYSLKHQEDPVETYTRPMIARIVADRLS